mgnify:CR=1 FL=1
MACKYSVKNGKLRIECTVGVYCPYQYWCNKDRCYKSTATKDKCNKYEEVENPGNNK